MRFRVAIIICTLLVFACSKDPQTTCDTSPCSVELPLSTESLDYIANYADVDSVVFENSSGEEVVFTIGYDSLYQGQCRAIEISGKEYCEEDGKFYSEVTGTSEECKVILRSPDVDFLIFIWLRHQYTLYDCEWSIENLNVNIESESEELFFNYGLMHYLVGYGPPDVTYAYSRVHKSLTLNETEFYDVIVSTFDHMAEGNIDFAYNIEFGLVGIIDNRNGETYSYVRVE